MSKFLLSKYVLLLTLLFNLAIYSIGQDSFKLSGVLLMDKKAINEADVTVYLGSKLITQTTTNKLGKFIVALAFQQVYVIQFKKAGLPTQKVIISTRAKDLEEDFTKTKVVVFALSSAKVSNEGPGTKDAIASFQINKNGMLVEGEHEFSKIVDVTENEQNNVTEQVEELQHEIEVTIAEIPEPERKELLNNNEALKAKMDSILYLADKKAGIILYTARLKSEELSDNALLHLPEAANSKKESSVPLGIKVEEDLKKLAIEKKPFLEREDIKSYKSKINEFNNKSNLSKKDSIGYLQTVVLFKDEMVKSAKLQLKIDKLNAKTKEDSIELQQREAAIFLAEKEIDEAKNKIEIQQLEIKQKNTMLMFTISALFFFVLVSLMVYKSFRNKKKTNAILEKQNVVIANKNKKIIDSIRYAQTIQQAILPIKSNIDKYFEWFVIFQPKDIVSGDFYWFNHFEGTGKSVFAVVDCTGHGVPGAFMSMIGNRLLIEAVKEKEIVKPVDILEDIDASIRIALMQDETSNNDGMDMCVCIIEYTSDNKCKIDFAGAKRPMFYSDRKEGVMKHIKGTVRGIGGKKRLREKPKKLFEEHSIVVDKGEMLYLTTDGFFDLQSPNRKKFGRKNFMNLLEQHVDKSLPEQKEAIMDALHIHKGSEFQIDDITIIGIKL